MVKELYTIMTGVYSVGSLAAILRLEENLLCLMAQDWMETGETDLVARVSFLSQMVMFFRGSGKIASPKRSAK